MKRDFNAWLKTLGDKAPVKRLTELRTWNVAHARGGSTNGQANLDAVDEMDVLVDRDRYDADRRKDILLSSTNGLDAAIHANRPDAMLFKLFKLFKLFDATAPSLSRRRVGEDRHFHPAIELAARLGIVPGDGLRFTPSDRLQA